jgi:hypothetical protein
MAFFDGRGGSFTFFGQTGALDDGIRVGLGEFGVLLVAGDCFLEVGGSEDKPESSPEPRFQWDAAGAGV